MTLELLENTNIAPDLKNKPNPQDSSSLVGSMLSKVMDLHDLDKYIFTSKKRDLKEEDLPSEDENQPSDIDSEDEELETDSLFDEVQEDLEVEWDENTPVEDIISDEEIVKEFVIFLKNNSDEDGSEETESMDLEESKVMNEKNDAVLDDEDPDNDHYPEETNKKTKKKKDINDEVEDEDGTLETDGYISDLIGQIITY